MSGGSLPLPDPAVTFEVQPAAVAEWMALPPEQRPRLIDCREEEELAICRIDGHEWVRLDSFQQSIQRLANDSDRGVIIYCHHGMRSLRAAAFLRGHGVEKAFSMSGGIDAWSKLIDPAVPRY